MNDAVADYNYNEVRLYIQNLCVKTGISSKIKTIANDYYGELTRENALDIRNQIRRLILTEQYEYGYEIFSIFGTILIIGLILILFGTIGTKYLSKSRFIGIINFCLLIGMIISTISSIIATSGLFLYYNIQF